ncbi:MAG: carboxypeptidase regulatory-like domain-containing protein, partial [Planctomycetota bacterium]
RSPREREAQRASGPVGAALPEPGAAEPGPGSTAPKPERPAIPAGKGSVAGRVVFRDGTPLKRAKLQLWGSPAVTAETDDEGRFHIHGDWVGDRDLVVVGDNESYFPIGHVRMKADEVVDVDVTLLAGRVLEGTVVDVATRRRVPGAEVSFDRPGSAGAGVHQGSWGAAMTDAEGRFRFSWLPDGQYALSVEAKGLESLTREVAVSAARGPLEILMKPARRLLIRFENLPEALRGAPVTFAFHRAVGESLSVYRGGRIDERGQLRVDAPPVGDYIIATLNGATSLPKIEQRVTVTDTAGPEIVITLPPGVGVSGTLAPAGAGRTIHVLPADLRAKTDKRGRFAFGFLPAGDQELWVQVGRNWLLARSVRVPEVGALQVDLRLEGVTLRGTLVAEGDTWSKGLELRLPGGEQVIAKAGVDSRGNFGLPFVRPGEYDLIAWTESDMKPEPRRIRVGHEDVGLGRIQVQASVVVPVVVVAPPGTKLAGSHYVTGEYGGRPESARLQLDEQGRGHLRLKPGRWKLVVKIGDGPGKTIELDVRADRVPRVRLDLSR